MDNENQTNERIDTPIKSGLYRNNFYINSLSDKKS